MKGLFIVFHGFAAYSGISKKIAAQCDALGKCGADTHLCYLEIDTNGTQRRIVDGKPIHTFGSGIRAKLTKRLSLADITRYIRQEGIDFLYIRHDLNASPVLIHWLRKIHAMGVRTILEIPTYPYDPEFEGAGIKERMQLWIDRLFRVRMARHIDRIVTFSDERAIFGRPTIRISNGIDFGSVSLKTEHHDTSQELHLLAVANIHFWHGFDRIIEGLRNYYETRRKRIVRLRIVGDGIPQLLGDYCQQIEAYALQEYITLTGPRSGEELDAQFAWADMGIASLGRHRNGISTIKTLKNREYAARGIPFVYSETDSDFDTMPYVMKASADDSPVDIEALLHFYDSVGMSPQQIRSSIETTLSWQHQMARVVEEIEKITESRNSKKPNL